MNNYSHPIYSFWLHRYIAVVFPLCYLGSRIAGHLGTGGKASHLIVQLQHQLLPRSLTKQRTGIARESTEGIVGTMDLPSPTFSFYLPSVHDDCQLECRLYLPQHLQNIESASQSPIRGAIVAHPYAPLGGCYDDPIVGFVGGELLQAGYIVGTFNFRYYLSSALRFPI
jgi:hypothetical protein